MCVLAVAVSATIAEPAGGGSSALPSEQTVNGVSASPGPPSGRLIIPRATPGRTEAGTIQAIGFDDQTAPCWFAETIALTDAYFSQGVMFRGPGGNDGGAIIDECGLFNVTGYSPPNFLAFDIGSTMANGAVPQGPETLTFGPVASSVSILAGGESAGTIQLECFDVFHASLGTDTLVGTSNLQELEVVAPGIASCMVSFTGSVAVFDDLEYDQATVSDPVAIAAADFDDGIDHDYLALALAAVGYLPVDVMNTAEAAAAGANAVVVYAGGWSGTGLGSADLAGWVDAGHGLIESGDWHDYIPNGWDGQLPTPTVVTATLHDRGHPVVHGLDPTWPGRGFFYYGWPDGALGFALGSVGEVDLAGFSAPGFPPYDFGIAALERDLGAGRAGRAVYLGLNLGGPAAGANEARLLGQALRWITGGGLFADGFEIGTTEAWSGTVP